VSVSGLGGMKAGKNGKREIILKKIAVAEMVHGPSGGKMVKN